MTENQKEELTEDDIKFVEEVTKSRGLTEEQKKLLEEVLEIANRPRDMDKAII